MFSNPGFNSFLFISFLAFKCNGLLLLKERFLYVTSLQFIDTNIIGSVMHSEFSSAGQVKIYLSTALGPGT